MIVLTVFAIVSSLAIAEVLVVYRNQPKSEYMVDPQGNILDAMMYKNYLKIKQRIERSFSRIDLNKSFNEIEVFEITHSDLKGSDELVQDLRAEFSARLCMYVGI